VGGLPKNHKKKKRQSKKIEERGIIGRKHNPLGEVRESTTVWKSLEIFFCLEFFGKLIFS
jgi:hypothetical protein